VCQQKKQQKSINTRNLNKKIVLGHSTLYDTYTTSSTIKNTKIACKPFLSVSWNSVGCKTQLDGLEIVDSKLLFAEAARLEIPAPQSPERRHLFEIVQSKTVNWKVERRGRGEEKSKVKRRKKIDFNSTTLIRSILHRVLFVVPWKWSFIQTSRHLRRTARNLLWRIYEAALK